MAFITLLGVYATMGNLCAAAPIIDKVEFNCSNARSVEEASLTRAGLFQELFRAFSESRISTLLIVIYAHAFI